jgi:hypothetical protein
MMKAAVSGDCRDRGLARGIMADKASAIDERMEKLSFKMFQMKKGLF